VSNESSKENSRDARAGVYRMWAVASSMLCAGLIAYVLIAKASESPSVVAAPPPVSKLNLNASTDPTVGREPATHSTLPPELQGLTTEWISATEDRDGKVFAALIDFEQRREVILESCQHQGYFDDERREPLKAGWQCERALMGKITGVRAGQMALVVPTGSPLSIGIARTGAPSEPHLQLSFGEQRIDLIPGSKNDLLQRYEQSLAIATSRERAIQHELGRLEEARREAKEQRK
jgi:hypothetical protein